MSDSITRRSAIGALLAATASLMMAPSSVAAATTAVSDLDAWLASALGGKDLAAIAAAWRAQHPKETREATARLVLAGRRSGEALHAYLSRVVAAEHAAGAAALYDGWLLTPTEVRLVALL